MIPLSPSLLVICPMHEASRVEPFKEHLTWSSKTWSLFQMCYLIWKYSWEIHMIAPCLFLHLRLRRYFSCLFRGSNEIPGTQTPSPLSFGKGPQSVYWHEFQWEKKEVTFISSPGFPGPKGAYITKAKASRNCSYPWTAPQSPRVLHLKLKPGHCSGTLRTWISGAFIQPQGQQDPSCASSHYENICWADPSLHSHKAYLQSRPQKSAIFSSSTCCLTFSTGAQSIDTRTFNLMKIRTGGCLPTSDHARTWFQELFPSTGHSGKGHGMEMLDSWR